MPVDPFCADDERTMTFLLPTPGVRATRPAVSRPPRLDERPSDAPPAPTVGLNPLVAAAHPLLALVPQIRATASLSDLDALKQSLARGLREFEARARERGVPPERARAARYILCTVLDEAAASTPWGGSGQWGAAQTLLVAFHGDNLGGNKVIDLMAHLAEDPAANRDLLELIYAALALGFEGRFQGVPE